MLQTLSFYQRPSGFGLVTTAPTHEALAELFAHGLLGMLPEEITSGGWAPLLHGWLPLLVDVALLLDAAKIPANPERDEATATRISARQTPRRGPKNLDNFLATSADRLAADLERLAASGGARPGSVTALTSDLNDIIYLSARIAARDPWKGSQASRGLGYIEAGMTGDHDCVAWVQGPRRRFEYLQTPAVEVTNEAGTVASQPIRPHTDAPPVTGLSAVLCLPDTTLPPPQSLAFHRLGHEVGLVSSVGNVDALVELFAAAIYEMNLTQPDVDWSHDIENWLHPLFALARRTGCRLIPRTPRERRAWEDRIYARHRSDVDVPGQFLYLAARRIGFILDMWAAEPKNHEQRRATLQQWVRDVLGYAEFSRTQFHTDLPWVAATAFHRTAGVGTGTPRVAMVTSSPLLVHLPASHSAAA